MNIQQTITNELAEDIQRLLGDYLVKAKSNNDQNKNKVVKVMSELTTQGELSESSKRDLQKHSPYALAAAGALAAGTKILDASIDILAYNKVLNTGSFSATVGIGVTMMLSALYLNSKFKKLNPVEENEWRIPASIQNILENNNGNELVDDYAKLKDALSFVSQEDFKEIEQLAWVSANRNDIQAQIKPIEPQYNRSSQARMAP